MKQLIGQHWRASKKTIDTLIKEGWSDEQRKSILITFINRYLNQEIESPSTKYLNMVRSSGIPHNAKKPKKDTAIKEREAKMAQKSPQSAEKCEKVQEGGMKKFTREEAIAEYNRLRSQSGG